MQLNQIKDKLIKNFPNDAVEVFDTRGTGDHFSIIVISNKLFCSTILLFSLFN